MFGFSTHAIDKSRIQYTVYAGRPCFGVTVLQTDETGNWGDSPETPLRRSQYKCLNNYQNGDSIDESFSTCIPVDWHLEGRCALWDFHYVASKPDLLFVIIKDAEYLLFFHNTIVHRSPVIPDEWIDWRVAATFNAKNGALSVFKNDTEVFVYNGDVLDSASDNVYFKIGPYIYDPMILPYRRMYFQI